MGVQAQHPSYAFSHDFCNWAGNNLMEELQKLQDQRDLLGLYGIHLGGVNNGTVFSEPQSELTCNASGTRKRPREEPPMALQQPIQNHDCNLASISPRRFYPNLAAAVVPVSAAGAVSTSGCQQRGLLESGGTSTSSRPASPLAPHLVSLLCHQNTEIDALVRLQTERLRSGLEAARKRRCSALLRGVERQVARRLMEKESELEEAQRRNAELEEKVRQVITERQMWFTLAKNNEAIAASLRANLERVLLQNAAAVASQSREGYGDTNDDGAQSCCFEETTMAGAAAAELRRCRACGEREACVLLLPCRHLCLCNICESMFDACPACLSIKNSCFQIFTS